MLRAYTFPLNRRIVKLYCGIIIKSKDVFVKEVHEKYRQDGDGYGRNVNNRRRRRGEYKAVYIIKI